MKEKVYGRTARIAALAEALAHAEQIPDMCIDMMYTILINF